MTPARLKATATATPRRPEAGVRGAVRYGVMYRVNECQPRLQWPGWDQLKPTAARGPAVILYVLAPTVSGREAGWVAECDRRLEELLELEDDWDTYGAASPNHLAVSLAKKVVRLLSKTGLPPPCINPSAEEGICMSFRAGSLYADIECFNTGEILAATSDGEGDRRVWEVDSREREIIGAARLIQTYLSSRDS